MKDYNDGMSNGLKHGDPIPGVGISDHTLQFLYEESLRKAERGAQAGVAYWQGYLDGVKQKEELK